MLIYPIYYHNWRNISTICIYEYNKTSIEWNIVTIKQNTSGSKSGYGLIRTPVYVYIYICINYQSFPWAQARHSSRSLRCVVHFLPEQPSNQATSEFRRLFNHLKTAMKMHRNTKFRWEVWSPVLGYYPVECFSSQTAILSEKFRGLPEEFKWANNMVYLFLANCRVNSRANFTLCVHTLSSADVLRIVFTSTKDITYNLITHIFWRRSQWPRGLRRRSTAVCLLRSWVRIPPRTWLSVCC
jgi:hypothetical protein